MIWKYKESNLKRDNMNKSALYKTLFINAIFQLDN